jgi:hypothetical protein
MLDTPIAGLILLILWCGVGGQILLYLQPKFDALVLHLVSKLLAWTESHS